MATEAIEGGNACKADNSSLSTILIHLTYSQARPNVDKGCMEPMEMPPVILHCLWPRWWGWGKDCKPGHRAGLGTRHITKICSSSEHNPRMRALMHPSSTSKPPDANSNHAISIHPDYNTANDIKYFCLQGKGTLHPALPPDDYYFDYPSRQQHSQWHTPRQEARMAWGVTRVTMKE